MRYSQRLKKAATDFGRKLASIRWRREKAARALNPPVVDADTLRERALADRKGSLVWVDIVTIRYSRNRTNQYDVWVDGVLVYTGGAARMGQALISYRKSCLQTLQANPR